MTHGDFCEFCLFLVLFYFEMPLELEMVVIYMGFISSINIAITFFSL